MQPEFFPETSIQVKPWSSLYTIEKRFRTSSHEAQLELVMKR